MDRRQFIAAGAGVATATVAGCTGMLGDDDRIDELETEVESLEADLDDREDALDERDDEIAALEDRESTLESEIEELESELQETESDLDASDEAYDELVADRLERLYEMAELYTDLGDEEYEEAVAAWEGGQYGRSARYFGVAFRSYDSAQELTYQARQLADDDDHSTAIDLLLEANTYCELMKMVADYYGLAAEYYSEGNTAQGDDAIDEGDAYRADANRERFPPLREFRNAL